MRRWTHGVWTAMKFFTALTLIALDRPLSRRPEHFHFALEPDGSVDHVNDDLRRRRKVVSRNIEHRVILPNSGVRSY